MKTLNALYVERVLSPSLLGSVQPAVRRLKDLMPVLYDASSCRDIDPELPVYEVYRDICSGKEQDILLKHGLRYDVTVMPPMLLGKEHVKTVGHMHSPCRGGSSYPEVLEVIEGEALFLIQRFQGENVTDVSLVVAKAGDRVVVPPNSGHVMINASSNRLVVGNLVSRFSLETYGPFIERRGGAYYLLAGHRPIRNEKYCPALDMRMAGVDAFPDDERSGVLVSLLSNPESFAFLNNPRKFQQLEAAEPGLDLRQADERVTKDNVTVVIPTLNEAEAVEKIIEEVESEGYANVVVVDGYSTDKTAEIVEGMGIKVFYQHGAGKAGAVKTAIEHAETPYIVFIDGDHTYDPKDIWRLLNHNDHYAHVIGTRDKRHISRLHRLGNWVISQTFSLLFGVKATDVCSGMYLLRTKEARKYSLEEPGFIVEIELAAQSASMGTLAEVPISYRPRIGTRKLNTWRHGIAILSAAFRMARRHNPVLLYSGLTGLAILPATPILAWVALEQLTAGVWHSGLALVGMMFLLVAALSFVLASVSILIRQVERRLMKEIKSLT